MCQHQEDCFMEPVYWNVCCNGQSNLCTNAFNCSSANITLYNQACPTTTTTTTTTTATTTTTNTDTTTTTTDTTTTTTDTTTTTTDTTTTTTDTITSTTTYTTTNSNCYSIITRLLTEGYMSSISISLFRGPSYLCYLFLLFLKILSI